MIASLAYVLVSRTTFNLRDPREHSAACATTTTVTTATSSVILLHMLTKVEDVDEPTIYRSQNHRGGLFYDATFCKYYDPIHRRDVEMVPIDDRSGHVGA